MVLNVAPPSMETAAFQLLVAKITLPDLAPLGSDIEPGFCPVWVLLPKTVLVSNTMPSPPHDCLFARVKVTLLWPPIEIRLIAGDDGRIGPLGLGTERGGSSSSG